MDTQSYYQIITSMWKLFRASLERIQGNYQNEKYWLWVVDQYGKCAEHWRGTKFEDFAVKEAQNKLDELEKIYRELAGVKPGVFCG